MAWRTGNDMAGWVSTPVETVVMEKWARATGGQSQGTGANSQGLRGRLMKASVALRGAEPRNDSVHCHGSRRQRVSVEQVGDTASRWCLECIALMRCLVSPADSFAIDIFSFVPEFFISREYLGSSLATSMNEKLSGRGNH